MHTLRHFVFLTLVVATLTTFSFHLSAAVPTPSPDFTDTETTAPSQPPADLSKESLIDLATPPPLPQQRMKERAYYHPYRYGLSALLGSHTESNTGSSQGVFYSGDVLFQFPLKSETFYEAGASLNSNQSGSLSFARKLIYSKSRLRPYLKLGFGVRIDPSDQLVTLLKYENYQLRLGAGLEASVYSQLSLRLNLEGVARTSSTQFGGSFGCTWSW